jgi:transposase
MKTVTLGRDAAGQPRWSPAFWRFATEIGCHPEVCDPFAAQQKGSVENLVKWVKTNFLPGRAASPTTRTWPSPSRLASRESCPKPHHVPRRSLRSPIENRPKHPQEMAHLIREWERKSGALTVRISNP